MKKKKEWTTLARLATTAKFGVPSATWRQACFRERTAGRKPPEQGTAHQDKTEPLTEPTLCEPATHSCEVGSLLQKPRRLDYALREHSAKCVLAGRGISKVLRSLNNHRLELTAPPALDPTSTNVLMGQELWKWPGLLPALGCVDGPSVVEAAETPVSPGHHINKRVDRL